MGFIRDTISGGLTGDEDTSVLGGDGQDDEDDGPTVTGGGYTTYGSGGSSGGSDDSGGFLAGGLTGDEDTNVWGGGSDDSGGSSGGSDDSDNNAGGFLDSVRDGAGDAVDGAADAAADFAEDPTGIEEWRESESGQDLQEEAANADGPLDLFNTSVKAGTDFVLDNPNASIQDASRDAIAAVTGAEDGEDVAEAAQDIDEGVTNTIDDAVEGTPFDNKATDAVRTAGDVLIGDLIRTGVGAATGIDTETGGTEANTGALELADIGLTVGTAGAGKAATTALRGGDDVFNIASRAGDDAVDAATSAGDDLVSRIGDTVDRAQEAFSRGGDETPFNVFRGGDDAARTATGAVDEAADAAARSSDETPFSVFRGGDDAAEAASRTSDDLFSLPRQGAGAAARIASNNPLATAAAGTAGAVVAAGAAHDQLFGGGDEVELTDEDGDKFTIYRTETFAPTQRRPNGGVLWRVEQNGSVQGFTVVLAVNGQEVVLLDKDGGTMTSTQTTTTELSQAAQRAREARTGRTSSNGGEVR